MALQCENCQKIFPSNASLYQHKYSDHGNSHDKISPITSQAYNDTVGSNFSSKRPRVVEEFVDNEDPSAVDDLHNIDGVGTDKKRKCTGKKPEDHNKLITSKPEDIIEPTQVLEDNGHKREVIKLKKLYEGKISDLEDSLRKQSNEKYQNMVKQHEKLISDVKISHEKELYDNERECQRKLDLLSDQIKAVQTNDEDLSSLSKAIFNWDSMEEILKIQHLVSEHQLDSVVQNYLPGLQNLFLGLSHGIIPLCQPQREQVTDDQRRVVEKLQTAFARAAKKIARENRAEIIKLLSIVKYSIKLARDSFNQYAQS